MVPSNECTGLRRRFFASGRGGASDHGTDSGIRRTGPGVHQGRGGEVIAANPELREREVLKVATLEDLLCGVLAERGVPERQTAYLVRLALTVYEQAFAQWIAPGARATFERCVADADAELQRALSARSPS